MIKLESGFYETCEDIYDNYGINAVPQEIPEENVLDFVNRLIGEDNEFRIVEKYDPKGAPGGYSWSTMDCYVFLNVYWLFNGRWFGFLYL